jgi:hypothetical protein
MSTSSKKENMETKILAIVGRYIHSSTPHQLIIRTQQIDIMHLLT